VSVPGTGGVAVHLVDGTWELFRQHFGRPSHRSADGREVAAARGVAASLLAMVAGGATHVGVATDHVIESFRNDLWPGYKSSAGVPAELLAQFGLVEELLDALGFPVWPMVELEADDALASAARIAAADGAVGRVLICTPDKDLAQCVRGDRVVQLDRRHDRVIDEAAVRARFGVPPAAVPDWLALVGDSADGYPGVPGFGPRTAGAVLGRYGRLEDIPLDGAWDVPVRGAAKLAATLAEHFDLALLFRDLATLRDTAAVFSRLEDLRWRGPSAAAEGLCRRIDAPDLARRARRLADASVGGAADP
jgi:5'-3' exonuclease